MLWAYLVYAWVIVFVLAADVLLMIAGVLCLLVVLACSMCLLFSVLFVV